MPSPLPSSSSTSRGKRPHAGGTARPAAVAVDLGGDGSYTGPTLDLLGGPDVIQGPAHDPDKLAQNAQYLASVLDDFGVKGEIVKVRPGPVVTLYELEPAPGTKTSRVVGLSDDMIRKTSFDSC